MLNTEFERAEKRKPHSFQAEKSVIACLLQNNELVDEVVATLSPKMFYDNMFRAMFKSIIELWNEGFAIDEIILKDKVTPKAKGITITEKINNIRQKVVREGFDASKLDDNFFAELLKSVPITNNIKEYCSIVKEKYILRKAISTCDEIILDCMDGQIPTKEILNNAQNKFFDYAKEDNREGYQKIDAGIKEVLAKIEEASKTKDGITGVRTGYKMMDYKTAGFQKGNMIVLAARPGMGKTAFSMNMAYNMSKLHKQNVLFFSLEMNKNELLMRAISLETGISGSILHKGKLSDKQWIELLAGTKRIHDTSIYVDDNPYLTIAELRNKCLKLASDLKMKDEKLDIVFIDYLQLMHAGINYSSSRGFASRQEEVAEISRSIKGLAKELEIPIVALAQLSRAAEEKKKPQLSDLRESGAIEQDADIVMFIHSNRNDPDAEDKDRTEIIFAKHRSGETGSIYFKFDNATTRFNELDSNY